MNIIERRKIQREYYDNKAQIVAGGLGIVALRKLQRRQVAILKELGIDLKAKAKVVIKAVVSRLEQLLAGKYNQYKPFPFIELVRDIVEKGEASVDQVKAPVIEYHAASMAT